VKSSLLVHIVVVKTEPKQIIKFKMMRRTGLFAVAVAIAASGADARVQKFMTKPLVSADTPLYRDDTPLDNSAVSEGDTPREDTAAVIEGVDEADAQNEVTRTSNKEEVNAPQQQSEHSPWYIILYPNYWLARGAYAP